MNDGGLRIAVVIVIMLVVGFTSSLNRSHALVLSILDPKSTIWHNSSSQQRLRSFDGPMTGDLSFYLNELPNDEMCLYSKEIYHALADHPSRVHSIYDAKIVFTMYSNERAYHRDSCNRDYARTSTDACARIAKSIEERFPNASHVPPHYVFYGSDFVDPQDSNCKHVVNLPYIFLTKRMWPSNNKREGAINAVYMSQFFNPSKDILLPPPDADLTDPRYDRTSFRRGVDKYWIAFKGSIDHGYARKQVLEAITPLLSSGDIVFEDTTSKAHTYNDLMMNTTFLLHVDGDLPWTYRFTEILKSGAMPVLIEHEYVLFPFSQLIDWDRALIRIPLRDVGCISAVLASYDEETLRKKYQYLEFIVKTYLLDRRTQMRWLLFLLNKMVSE